MKELVKKVLLMVSYGRASKKGVVSDVLFTS